MNYIADTLIKTRELIIYGDTWCQGSFADSQYERKTKHCLVGAIATAMDYPFSDIGNGDIIDDVIDHVADSIREQPTAEEKVYKFIKESYINEPESIDYVLAYNDYSSHKEVIEVVDHSIEAAKKIGELMTFEGIF